MHFLQLLTHHHRLDKSTSAATSAWLTGSGACFASHKEQNRVELTTEHFSFTVATLHLPTIRHELRNDTNQIVANPGSFGEIEQQAAQRKTPRAQPTAPHPTSLILLVRFVVIALRDFCLPHVDITMSSYRSSPFSTEQGPGVPARNGTVRIFVGGKLRVVSRNLVLLATMQRLVGSVASVRWTKPSRC